MERVLQEYLKPLVYFDHLHEDHRASYNDVKYTYWPKKIGKE